MHVTHFFEFGGHVTGGIAESVRHQRRMLESLDISYTTEPRPDTDLVHLNLMGPRSVVLAVRARRRDVPVVIHTHVTAEDFRDSMRFSNLLSRPLRPYLKRAYGLADRLICPSTYTRSLMQGYTDVPAEVISNGIDASKLDGFEDLRETYLDRFDLEPPVVYCVGHVLKRKGLETFVETAERLPEYSFAWFGPIDRRLKGRSTTRLIDRAPPNCTFTGYLDDIRGAYAAGDVFLFPTHEENEGMTVLESMYTAKPMVLRDIETFDWLEHGTHCLKVDDGFTEAVRSLEDEDRRATLGSNAAALATEYTLKELAPKLGTCYARAMDDTDPVDVVDRDPETRPTGG